MAGLVEELSPRAFSDLWPEEHQDRVQLLDIREPQELAIVSLTRARHIAMREIPSRLDELDPRQPVVVMCHTGQRSRHVAAFLLANRFEQVYNLTGGIDAWSTEIDPGLPRY